MDASKDSDLFIEGAKAIARAFAPAMPWLYIALRRAFIPTLIAICAALLFFLLPQAREVLHGLSEPKLDSFMEFQQDPGINHLGLLYYVLTSLSLVVAAWYSARLLSSIGVQESTPNVLRDDDGASRLGVATIWYPRALAIFVAWVATAALIAAAYMPALLPWQAWLLGTLTPLAPIGVAASILSRAGWILWRIVIGAGAALLTLACWYFLFVAHAKVAMALWSLAFALVPAAFFTGFSFRQATKPTRMPYLAFIAVMLAQASYLVALGKVPSHVLRELGSAAAVLFFLATTCLFLTACQLLLRRWAREVPGLTTATAVVVAILIIATGRERLGREALEPATALPQAAAMAPAAADAAPVPRTLYVNAYGGGLRAAFFTAQVLARADDLTCGAFGDRIAGLSGVSGGSVGVSIYLIARQEMARHGGWTQCAENDRKFIVRTPLTDIVTHALVQDHLSPVVGRMVAADTLPGVPVRGQALLDSLNEALAKSLDRHLKSSGKAQRAALAMPLGQLSGGMRRPPAVYFNATDADTGHLTWFSNEHEGSAGTYGGLALKVRLSVGQAVLHSARFPIASPAGEYRTQWDGRVARLVDGGYVDNSGTTKLLEVASRKSPPPPHEAGSPFRLINIDGNPDEESPCNADSKSDPIGTGVRAILQARSAHALAAVKRFEDAMPERAISVRFDLESTFADADPETLCKKVRHAAMAPLGWYMSYESARTAAYSARREVEKLCAAAKLDCRTPTGKALQPEKGS